MGSLVCVCVCSLLVLHEVDLISGYIVCIKIFIYLSSKSSERVCVCVRPERACVRVQQAIQGKLETLYDDDL